nr:MAG TPA: hypothetical protein [Caudoviricetes sp.]
MFLVRDPDPAGAGAVPRLLPAGPGARPVRDGACVDGAELPGVPAQGPVPRGLRGRRVREEVVAGGVGPRGR